MARMRRDLKEGGKFEDLNEDERSNTETHLKEIGLEGVNWIDEAQDGDKWLAVVQTVMNHWVPQNVGNFLTHSGTVSFSTKTVRHGVICIWKYSAVIYCRIRITTAALDDKS